MIYYLCKLNGLNIIEKTRPTPIYIIVYKYGMLRNRSPLGPGGFAGG